LRLAKQNNATLKSSGVRAAENDVRLRIGGHGISALNSPARQLPACGD
jgi:hypothetical protein